MEMRLNVLPKQYHVLKNIVTRMLCADEVKRITLDEIVDILSGDSITKA